jgi:hypothetical protein
MAAEAEAAFAALTSETEPVDQYFAGLGQFIHEFARAENLVYFALALQTRMDLAVARVVLSGVSLDQAKSQILRSRQALGLPEDPVLKRAFAQLSVIANARNQIVHNGARFNEGELIAQSMLDLISNNTRRAVPVSIEGLKRMIADLRTIQIAVALYIIEIAVHNPQAKFDGGAPPIAQLRDAASVPWNYPPPPEPKTPTPRQQDF